MRYRLWQTVGVVLALQMSAFARCPIPDGATLVVRAPIGNLLVDTTGRDSADVTVNNSQMEPHETCGKDRVLIDAAAVPQMRGSVDWKLIVPKTVNLDLVTLGGSISIGDSDGNVTLRTTGGSVTVGQIKGRAAIITQGGFIKCGNVGDDAELRTQGGTINVGNVNGDAVFETAVGTINAGMISGKVTAQTAGGDIIIKEVHGDVSAHTDAGNISLGDAGRTNARSAGGSIIAMRVRGPLQAHTESGDIRVENASAWVEASTGFGNISVKLVPVNYNGDLHVDLQTGVGDVTVYLPPRLKATVDAIVERPAFNAQNFFSDFPMNSLASRNQSAIGANRYANPSSSHYLLNGGGNSIKLSTSLGTVSIKKN
jgi:hypothetical protein